MAGRKALNVEWEVGDLAKISTDGYFADLQKAKTQEGFTLADKTGVITEGFATSGKTIEAEYSTSFTAHTPIEPENATAWVQGDKVEIWAPLQAPDWAVQQYENPILVKYHDVDGAMVLAKTKTLPSC